MQSNFHFLINPRFPRVAAAATASKNTTAASTTHTKQQETKKPKSVIPRKHFAILGYFPVLLVH